jgi:hypothetical protein
MEPSIPEQSAITGQLRFRGSRMARPAGSAAEIRIRIADCSGVELSSDRGSAYQRSSANSFGSHRPYWLRTPEANLAQLLARTPTTQLPQFAATALRALSADVYRVKCA